MDKNVYANIDELQARTSLEQAAAFCSVTLDVKGNGKEVRIDCPFGCCGDHCGRKEVAINTENAQKVFLCHSYACKFRGNLLTLMHGWLTGSRPTGDKLKGEEFRTIRDLLSSGVAPRPGNAPDKVTPIADSPAPQGMRNVPLIQSPEDKARELHNIHEKFVVDVGAMNATATIMFP